MDALEIKGFLGPTLEENTSLPSVGTTAARAAGVSVDDDGKLRCPPGRANQGEFTDIGMSNCGPAVEEDPAQFAQKALNKNNYVNFVATDLLYNFNAKVGIFRSNTRLGRAAQGVGSFILPGDTSDIRKPVRSTVYEALTPGGGGGRGVPGGGRRGRNYTRCPVGFEFGGRFAAKDFSNCGRQLFEVPTSLDDLGNGTVGGRLGSLVAGAASTARNLLPDGDLFPGAGDSGGRAIPGLSGRSSRAVQIQRNARIPRVGGSNSKARDTAVNLLLPYVRKEPDTETKFMVRRDGYTMQPVVPSNILATVRRNPDMEDATFIVNAPKPAKMADAEVPLLWKVNAQSVVVGLPDGGSVELNRVRPATRGERRKLTAAWEKASVSGELDYGERLRSIAEASGGLLEYKEKLKNPKNANDLVTFEDENGTERTVRRWVYEAFLSDEAPGRKKGSGAKLVSETQNSTSNNNEISSLEEAKDAVRSSTDLDKVPSKFLEGVLADTTIGSKKRFGNNSTLVTVGDREYLKIKSDKRFGALAARTSADLQTELGLPSTTVKFVGDGPDRGMLVSTPNRALFDPGRADKDKDIDFDQELALALSDYVLDQRDRNPNSIIPVAEKEKVQALVMPDTNSALAGLSPEELEKRRELVLGEFYTAGRKQSIVSRYEKLEDTERKKLQSTYSGLLKKLRDFNWDDYVSRLGLDGGLSDAEKKHLNIIKRLFESRLTRLATSFDSFLKTLQ
jgi:hypothetical protein